ncbi:PAAR domain-containing protein [Xenorhabdus bovienii]|uniref:PAAR domain-containing protein n=1 Tax=Xenorhabdus bovienii TaxID=40576 RepID=UPI0030B98570|nr:PAAR domain-containing protein [Xenorhabdus bovienii]
MAIGHFLTVGDKTSCGGVVLTGTSNITFYGRDAAIEGSFVTCGKHSGNFSIVGGVNCFFDMGAKLAGTLDSQSTCPCRANLINSIPDSYLPLNNFIDWLYKKYYVAQFDSFNATEPLYFGISYDNTQN